MKKSLFITTAIASLIVSLSLIYYYMFSYSAFPSRFPCSEVLFCHFLEDDEANMQTIYTPSEGFDLSKLYDQGDKLTLFDLTRPAGADGGMYSLTKRGGANSPLDQFFIREYITLLIILLGNLKLSFTNMGFYLTLAAFIGSTMNIIATNFRRLISNLWSSSQESIYATIHSIVINQINAVRGQAYFPFIFVLFVFILTSNLIGMIPYSFSTTSHFILTFFISFTVVVGSTFLGFSLHFLKFLSILVPSGCPLPLLPLLVLIEAISYLARNVSLGLRLAANVLSGHMLLNILSGFVYNIMKAGFLYFFISFIPLSFIMAFSALEIGISFIQAQVFSVLSASYIKDGLDLH